MSIYDKTDLCNKVEWCTKCKNHPIKIKKRKLCGVCYEELRSSGLLEPLEKIHSASKESRKKIEKKYGSELFKELELYKKAPTLKELADKHGVTRSRMQQIYKEHVA